MKKYITMIVVLALTSFAQASDPLDQKVEVAGNAVEKAAEAEVALAVETLSVTAHNADRTKAAVIGVLKKLQPIGEAAVASTLDEVPPVMEATTAVKAARHKLVQQLVTSGTAVVEKTAKAIEDQIPTQPKG